MSKIKNKVSVRFATEEELPDRMWGHGTSLAYRSNLKKTPVKEINTVKRISLPMYVNYSLREERFIYYDSSIYLDGEDDNPHINLAKLVIELELPDVTYDDCVKTYAESLRRKKKEILAKAHKEALGVQNQLDELLAIECKI